MTNQIERGDVRVIFDTLRIQLTDARSAITASEHVSAERLQLYRDALSREAVLERKEG